MATATELVCSARPGWSARRSSSCWRAREFPAAEVVPFASERSAGKEIEWNGRRSPASGLDEDSIQGLDLVLSSAGGSVSAEWTPRFVAAGATVVDNTSYWRMKDDVPLVVSEVNPEALAGHKGIIANPNCSTMQMVVALKPLYDAAGIERLVVSTYQAVSGTGKAAIDELLDQSHAILHGQEPTAFDLSRTRSPSTRWRRRGASRTGTTTPMRSAS